MLMMGNDGENEALVKDAQKGSSWSFRRIVILVTLCVNYVLVLGVYSLPTSFLPTEAHDRGVSFTVVGVIFACYSLTACLFAAIWGTRLIPRYGPHRVLVFGLVSCSTCVFLFAICKLLPNPVSFASTAILLRSLSAIGAVACETSGMAIALSEFSDNLGLVSGLLESFAGVGLAVGSAVGGFLYTVGGFQLPFIVFGFTLVAVVPIFVALYKKQLQEPETCDKNGEEVERTSSLLQVLQIPGVFVIASCYVTVCVTLTINSPILAPWLQPVGLDAFHIGLIFLCMSLCYGLSAPVLGCIADKTHCYRLMIMVGFIGLGVLFLLLGPAPFLSSIIPTRNFWLMCVVMAFSGTQASTIFVALMPELKTIARNYGMPDDASTNGILSGIFSSMINLGSTIGPLLGGILYENVGYQWATAIAGFVCITQGLIIVIFVTIEKLVKRKNVHA